MLFVGEEHINVFQKSPFGNKIIQDFSPKELKLIIPNKTYQKSIETRHDNKEIIDEIQIGLGFVSFSRIQPSTTGPTRSVWVGRHRAPVSKTEGVGTPHRAT